MKKFIVTFLMISLLCVGVNARGSSSGSNPPPPPPPQRKNFTLTVNCNEYGAQVFVDGNCIGDVNRSYDLKPGRYSVRIEKPGFEPYKVDVDLDGNRTISANLRRLPPPRPREFSLTVNCNERGAKIFVDGNFVGEANKIIDLRPGVHSVKIEKPGFEDYKIDIDLDHNRTIDANLRRLPPPPRSREFSLTVNCNERGAKIYIDGNFVGEANKVIDLRLGKHSVRVEKQGFEDYKIDVDLDHNRTIDANLRRLPPPPQGHDDHRGPGPHHGPDPHHNNHRR